MGFFGKKTVVCAKIFDLSWNSTFQSNVFAFIYHLCRNHAKIALFKYFFLDEKKLILKFCIYVLMYLHLSHLCYAKMTLLLVFSTTMWSLFSYFSSYCYVQLYKVIQRISHVYNCTCIYLLFWYLAHKIYETAIKSFLNIRLTSYGSNSVVMSNLIASNGVFHKYVIREFYDEIHVKYAV